ncbi:diaminopimelate dehydrogenase [Lederbergia graminis]|uniref:Meso-diaminopimelate D-dehydrogenase n=1 Tax=Lederbergia graminis TaxID=735518 RepID=A0ABW0LHA1_9BACI|nr:diaminopimelate dehydrogenase [Paenibacillus bovis]HLU22320.1 diaminopimelate dehydrogenase [Bacillaceae bacterium]
MEKKIRIGITGYGNLGRGVEAAIKQNEDMQLVAVFSRRDPESVGVEDKSVKVLPITEARDYQAEIDVMILCGGSATDLPEQGPEFAQFFNTIDSFDTHAKIPEYFAAIDKVATNSGKTSIISVGWDPGMFSMNRLLGEAILPEGETYTFWGKGLSQGHSDAIRRVPGVKAGVQYTIPIEEAVNRVRNGENPTLTTKEKHLRECYVVAEDGADLREIEETIKTMPNYFADYETVVNFISEEELKNNHSKMMHGGFVIRSGVTGAGNKEIVEYSLKLDSNPEYTASVLVAYARAAFKMNQMGQAGAKTVFDVPIGLLSSKSPEQLRKELL